MVAFGVGLLVFAPIPILLRVFVLPALAWLALFGLAVPAAAYERLGLRDALVRGRRLASADYVHALGSLCALGIVYFVTRGGGSNGTAGGIRSDVQKTIPVDGAKLSAEVVTPKHDVGAPLLVIPGAWGAAGKVGRR